MNRKEDREMKKIYCHPEIRKVNLQVENLMGITDSSGKKSRFKSRDSYSFEDDDEEEITKSVWFDD